MGEIEKATRLVARRLARQSPIAKRLLKEAHSAVHLLQHTIAEGLPQVIKPRPRKLTVAITAACNLRCIGCRYGRDFMTGSQLPLGTVVDLLSDAAEAGIETVRLYGGEPLLHPDLPEMVRHASRVGLSPYVTTNGLLLDQKIERLYDAGLRNLTMGFYGVGEDFDRYVQRPGRFARLERSIASTRARYGDRISIQMNYLLTRQTCSIEHLAAAWAFAQRYDLSVTIDLVHYSLPYFTDGPEHELQFGSGDRPMIQEFVGELLRLKATSPGRLREELPSILSIPDWLIKGPEMRVPCDANKLIWVGADGTVQLCYAAFDLGNLHRTRLRDLLFSPEHRQAAQDAFALNCPNCHCEREDRIMKHLPSRAHYRRVQASTSS